MTEGETERVRDSQLDAYEQIRQLRPQHRCHPRLLQRPLLLHPQLTEMRRSQKMIQTMFISSARRRPLRH